MSLSVVWRQMLPVEVGADSIEDLAAELVFLPLQRVELEHGLFGQVIAILKSLPVSHDEGIVNTVLSYLQKIHLIGLQEFF